VREQIEGVGVEGEGTREIIRWGDGKIYLHARVGNIFNQQTLIVNRKLYGTRPLSGGRSKIPKLNPGLLVVGLGDVEDGLVVRFVAERVEHAVRLVDEILGDKAKEQLEDFRGRRERSDDEVKTRDPKDHVGNYDEDHFKLNDYVLDIPYVAASAKAQTSTPHSSHYQPDLYQLIDPTTPTGGFSHSLGLESSISHGLTPPSGPGLTMYVKHMLLNAWSSQLVYMLAAKRRAEGGGEEVKEDILVIDQHMTVSTTCKVAREAR
jgi:hypothetical protein